MMRKFLLNLLIVILYVSWVNGQDEFEEINHLQRKAKKPSFGHWLGPVGYGFGFHALAILYWLKVKAVIIAFIVGTAIFWGARHFLTNNRSCPKEVVHEGPIIPFNHGPLWSGHDHIPYSPSYSPSFPSSYSSFDHHHDHGFESYPPSSFLDSSPSTISGPEHFASDKKWKRQSRQSRQLESEEQISTIFFTFLGVDSDACRKRFVCEWEFKSKRTPITNLIFRIFGRGIFTKYLKDSNEIQTFYDCGRVHDECKFIEHHIPEKEYEDSIEENVVVHSHDNEHDINSTSSEVENENENEIESSTEVNNSNETRDDGDENNQNHEIVNNSINKMQNSQPEVKLFSIKNNGSVKEKNIITEKLFNRSRSKLRVVPIRS